MCVDNVSNGPTVTTSSGVGRTLVADLWCKKFQMVSAPFLPIPITAIVYLTHINNPASSNQNILSRRNQFFTATFSTKWLVKYSGVVWSLTQHSSSALCHGYYTPSTTSIFFIKGSTPPVKVFISSLKLSQGKRFYIHFVQSSKNVHPQVPCKVPGEAGERGAY